MYTKIITCIPNTRAVFNTNCHCWVMLCMRVTVLIIKKTDLICNEQVGKIIVGFVMFSSLYF